MSIQSVIEQAYEGRQELTPQNTPGEVRDAVAEALAGLNDGTLRVAAPRDSGWVVHEWLKKAVLLSFRITGNDIVDGGHTRYYDKIPGRYARASDDSLRTSGVRVVPPATARYGSYQAPGVVLMPCFINIGAYVDAGTMVDTWATVGSCAQIGRNVHLSGGVGIGGVLEPLQAAPTIIEDDCFIGARSEVVEGVVVERGAVLSMGVFIGQSTRIYDRAADEVLYGRVPAGAVVVPGTLPGGDGRYGLACAVIVKQVDARTRRKVGINRLLREAAESA